MLIIGYLVVILGCGFIGLYKAAQIKKRPKEIREMINALSLLDTEIYWGLTPLPGAFALIKDRVDSPWKEFFGKLEEKINKGDSASKAWSASIAEVRKFACLEDEDWKVIATIGKNLGRADRNEEHKQLDLGQKHLALLHEKTKNQAELKAKMWSYLGFLAGFALVIVIM